MIGRHLRTFLWLRWRLRINQLKRGGLANAVILAILAAGLVVLAVVLFVAALLVGLFALPQASPAVLLYVWDGLVLAFLFLWIFGLATELQRSEALSLDKFLHLPVSLTGVFLINYLSSLLSVNLILFVPAALGLSLGLLFSRGPAMLLLLPLLAAFVLMVTALTYQFQGWLAALMVNPRRRRTVMVVATTIFVLLSQLPALMNLVPNRKVRNQEDVAERLRAEDEAFRASLSTPRSVDERLRELEKYQRRRGEILRQYQEREQDEDRQRTDRFEETVRLVNVLVPPGWLALGARALAEGDVRPALLGILGLTLIGTASLWRSYRTTVRLYTGQFSAGRRRPVPAAPPKQAAPRGRRAAALLEWRFPGLSEQAAAIALAGFRSLTRAPEAKMMLLSPVLMLVIFGSMFVVQRPDLPEAVRPLLAVGAMAMVLLGLAQFLGNQFGLDRSGFRVFVLCPAGRRDMLLGKNLACAPLAVGMGVAVAGLVQAIYPMRIDRFLAVLPQDLSMYLLFCLLANCMSILTPMPISAGSLRPTNIKGLNLLFSLLFTFLSPLVLAPVLLPLGVEFALEELGWVRGWPIDLALSVAECTLVVFLYRLVLTWQGSWLQARERHILATVTAKVE